MTRTSRRIIGSLQKAIDILELFDDLTPELGITEMSEALELHKSTVAGLVYTLEGNHYLEQAPETRKYRLGFKLVERASTLLSQIEVRPLALPHLQELRDWCDESVNLALREGGHVVYIERLLSSQTLGMRAKVGYQAPLHCTALGKAILSRLPPAEVSQYVARHGLPAVTDRTITDSGRFVEELQRTRERGFALDDEENEIGVRCVAAAVLDHTGQPTAAISVSAPGHRLPLSEVPRYGEQVRETALAISRELGYGWLERSRDQHDGRIHL
jgi:IclR family KDG regulon transcriptional repressor